MTDESVPDTNKAPDFLESYYERALRYKDPNDIKFQNGYDKAVSEFLEIIGCQANPGVNRLKSYFQTIITQSLAWELISKCCEIDEPIMFAAKNLAREIEDYREVAAEFSEHKCENVFEVLEKMSRDRTTRVIGLPDYDE
jgi:hypothetical protein